MAACVDRAGRHPAPAHADAWYRLRTKRPIADFVDPAICERHRDGMAEGIPPRIM
jgi:hypothetical protein